MLCIVEKVPVLYWKIKAFERNENFKEQIPNFEIQLKYLENENSLLQIQTLLFSHHLKDDQTERLIFQNRLQNKESMPFQFQ
jgi:hypothetical protein